MHSSKNINIDKETRLFFWGIRQCDCDWPNLLLYLHHSFLSSILTTKQGTKVQYWNNRAMEKYEFGNSIIKVIPRKRNLLWLNEWSEYKSRLYNFTENNNATAIIWTCEAVREGLRRNPWEYSCKITDGASFPNPINPSVCTCPDNELLHLLSKD